MVDFKKLLYKKTHCELCGEKIDKHCCHEFDGHILCLRHFHMFLQNGLMFEGQDDEWHFEDEQDIEIM